MADRRLAQTGLFPRSARLLTGGQFGRLSREGKRIPGKALLLIVAPRSPAARLRGARLGIAVSRKYGDAHQRNRFKRLVRELFRRLRHSLPAIDLQVSPRCSPEKASLDLFHQDLLLLHHVYRHLSGQGSGQEPSSAQSGAKTGSSHHRG